MLQSSWALVAQGPLELYWLSQPLKVYLDVAGGIFCPSLGIDVGWSGRVCIAYRFPAELAPDCDLHNRFAAGDKGSSTGVEIRWTDSAKVWPVPVLSWRSLTPCVQPPILIPVLVARDCMAVCLLSAFHLNCSLSEISARTPPEIGIPTQRVRGTSATPTSEFNRSESCR